MAYCKSGDNDLRNSVNFRGGGSQPFQGENLQTYNLQSEPLIMVTNGSYSEIRFSEFLKSGYFYGSPNSV